MAQLGARLDGIEEVVGSNPIGSTKISCLDSLLETNKIQGADTLVIVRTWGAAVLRPYMILLAGLPVHAWWTARSQPATVAARRATP